MLTRVIRVIKKLREYILNNIFYVIGNIIETSCIAVENAYFLFYQIIHEGFLCSEYIR